MEKNLQNEEALKKFKKLAEEVNTCMFITATHSEHEHTRPMATVEVEEDGSLWFFTDIRSIKVEEIAADNTVHLVYAHPGKQSFMDVWGRGSIITDKEQMKAKWSPVVKSYFPQGTDDPNLALLKVQPTNVYYWEAETGKMVQAIKMAVAAVTGNPAVAKGAQGNLSL